MSDSVSRHPAYDGWQVRHLGFAAPGQAEIYEYHEGPMPGWCFRLQTVCCGISTGTELTHFSGSNPYLRSRWDADLKLFVDDNRHDDYPFRFSGYMQVGRCVASYADAVQEGDLVAMSYGHKTGHTANARDDLYFVLPPDFSPNLAVYVAQMGPICANGVLHADAEAFGAHAQEFGCGVIGQRVLVLGTGVVGLLTALMCQASGAQEVAVAGRNGFKLEIARELGLVALDTRECDIGTWCKENWHDPMGERGANIAFQCSGSDEMLSHGLRALQPQGALIDLGFYQGGAQAVQFGREFHHNGLRHICAQIERVPKPMRATWTRRRLSAQTLEFLHQNAEKVERLFTHSFPFEDAQSAFDLLSQGSRDALQVVLWCE